MIAVIFEAFPANGKREEYLALAASLKPELIKIAGFISVERFQSITHPEKVISLSFWESEASITQWRNMELHRAAQAEGRNSIFDEYRIRISHVVRDYSLVNREQAPADSKNV